MLLNRIAEERVEVSLGTPAMEIRDRAKHHDCDVIVIGTHSRRGLGLLLGSTANGVLHGTPCDVLAVCVGSPDSSPR